MAVLAALALVAACGRDGPTDLEPVPTSISLAVTSVKLVSLGETRQPAVIVRDQDGIAMSDVPTSWSSSAPGVAHVGATTGLITAVAEGSATITVEAGSARGTIEVTVVQTAASVAPTPPTVTLDGPAQTRALHAAVLDAGGTPIPGLTLTWTSGNASVATVTPDGIVTSVGGGTTSVMVRGSAGGVIATGTVTVQVVAELRVTVTALSHAVQNATYGPERLTSEGGAGTRVWSVVAGALPPGLSLSTGGMITGQPSSVGSFDFTAEVTSGAQRASQELTLSVDAGLVVQTAGLPDGVTGSPYGPLALQATGGDGTYVWSRTGGSGPLPPGVTLAPDGTLSGTPTTSGTFPLIVQVASGPQTATRSLTLAVGGILMVSPDPLPTGVQSAAYGPQALAATGGDGSYAWALAAGSGPLPPGIALAADGTLSGTPTTAGTYDFTVEVTSGPQTATGPKSLQIEPSLSVTTSSLPTSVQNVTYPQQTLTATGGDGSYAWALAAGSGPLPTGLTLSTGGIVSGTPTASGTFAFTAEVASGLQTATRALSITIEPVLAIGTTSLPSAVRDAAYGPVLLSATGGNGSYAWSLAAGSGPLPAGLTLAANGTLSGTPTELGDFAVTMRVASGIQTATRPFTITVLATLIITTQSVPDGVVNVAYGPVTLDAVGGGPYAWSLAGGSGPLPTGLTLSAGGVISGTPTQLGTFAFTVQVMSGGDTASRPLSITVGPLVLQPSERCSENPPTAVGTFEDATLEGVVRAALGVGAGTDLTCALLATLTDRLTKSDGAAPFVTSLVGIQNLTALTELDMRFNQIADIGILAELPDLVFLALGRNQISDISVLGPLASLNYVGLTDDPLGSIQPLVDNTSLGVGSSVFLEGTGADCSLVAILVGRGITVYTDCTP